MRHDNRQKIELSLVYCGKSLKAAKFKQHEDGNEFWLPLSRVDFDTNASTGMVIQVEVEEWLAEKEGLI